MPQITINAPSSVIEGGYAAITATIHNVSILSGSISSTFQRADDREGDYYTGGVTSISAVFSPPQDYVIDLGMVYIVDNWEINEPGKFTISINVTGMTFPDGGTIAYISIPIIDNDRAGTKADDVMKGDGGSNTLVGLSGNDILLGRAGADNLQGGTGNDTLDGGAGSDYMAGGSGNDKYWVDDYSDRVEEKEGEGIDTIHSTINYVIGDNVEHLVFEGEGDLRGTGNRLSNKITGNIGDNHLVGMDGNDSLRGDAGADTLDGGNGDDYLRGGTGADTMLGGGGDDRYYVDNVGDQAIELSSQGRDWVFSSISWTLGANLEALTLTGDTWINATGNSKGNAIYGNAGRNVITGGKGGDVMTGKASSDTFVFTSLSDSAVADSDRITDLNDGSDKIDMRQIDGDTTKAGIQGFTIVDAFSGQAGELVLAYDASTDITSLTVDVNGDGQADMLVRLNGEHESFDRFLFGGG